MKKKIIAGLVAIMAFATFAMFAGCIEKPASAPTATPTQTPKTDLSLGESAIVGDISFTVVRFEESYEYEQRRYGITYPEEGAKFLWVYVRAENIGEVARRIPSEYRVDILYKGDVIDCKNGVLSKGEIIDREIYYGHEKIYPTVSEEGWIIYEVPKGINISHAKICVDFEEGKTMTWSLTS